MIEDGDRKWDWRGELWEVLGGFHIKEWYIQNILLSIYCEFTLY